MSRRKEDKLLRFMDNENACLSALSEGMSTMQKEVHILNIQMAEHLAGYRLSLIETKTDVLNAVLEGFVEKEDHSSDLHHISDTLEKLSTSLDNKVDKSTVRILYITMSSVAAVIAWVYNKGI